MNWEAIGAIGEITGAVVVVLTLFYLARQIKDNSKEVRLSSIVASNHLINEAWEPIYYNDRNIHLWVSGLESPGDLSKEDQAVFSFLMARLTNSVMTAFSQNRYGLIDQDEFRKFAATLKSLLGTPGGKYWLENMGGSDLIPADVLEMIEGIEASQRSITVGSSGNGA